MSEIIGVVKEIYEGTVQKGRSKGKKFWSVTLDNDIKMSVFEENAGFISGIKAGAEYTFPTETAGSYINIIGKIIPVENVTESTDTSTVNITPTVTEGSERTYKNRISALQAAVDYIAGALGGTASEDDVISTAKKFETYINAGE